MEIDAFHAEELGGRAAVSLSLFFPSCWFRTRFSSTR